MTSVPLNILIIYGKVPNFKNESQDIQCILIRHENWLDPAIQQPVYL